MSEQTSTSSVQRRNRGTLLLIVGLSFGAMLVAGLLRFSGWRPSGHVNKGQMLQPYGDLREFSPIQADGRPYRWADSPRTWRIVAAPRDCSGNRQPQCVKLLENLDKVWRIMGREAAYSGQEITWDMMMNSKLDLQPKQFDYDLKMDIPPLPVPGARSADVTDPFWMSAPVRLPSTMLAPVHIAEAA